MPKLTAADEFFYHQIPEPLPNVATHHQHWRESYFFVAHPRTAPGDVIILTMAHFPAREQMDALQLGRIGGQQIFAQHVRPYDGDPHTTKIGPVTIDIVEPYKTVKLAVDASAAPVGLDLTFTARTRAHGLRRGTMKAGHEIIWDQSHMIQSGNYSGTYVYDGKKYQVDDWWGQRDHSWGIRDHSRCPLWMWLAIQLPDGMFAVWHWEYSNGRDGDEVHGLAGHVDLVLEGGKRIGIDAEGTWATPYGPYGGGLNQMLVRTDDGRAGTAIYEVTGAYHHHYFPVARAENLPPG